LKIYRYSEGNWIASYHGGNNVYGIEAFFDILIWDTIHLCIGIPILPICFLYQLFYLIIYF